MGGRESRKNREEIDEVEKDMGEEDRKQLADGDKDSQRNQTSVMINMESDEPDRLMVKKELRENEKKKE